VTDFARSFRQLQADERCRTPWILGAGLVAICAWFGWATCARLSLVEASADARVELDGATFPIEAPFLGRVVMSNLHVGRPVQRDEVLIELDSMPQQLDLKECQVKIAGLEPSLATLRLQIHAEENLRSAEELGSSSKALEAGRRVHEARITAEFAANDLARIESLYAQKVVSLRDRQKAQSEADRLRVAVTTLEAAAEEVPQEQQARNRQREVRVARLEGEVATLQAQRESLQATAVRLGYEIDRHRIRAPADGRIGEAPNLQVGAVVSEGARLGSIVPAGRLLVIAQYPAQAAFGRMRAGQSATFRLAGFPWAEFGTVPATVAHVAQEIRDGTVRVELTLAPGSNFRGTLAHGMPGTLEVAVDRVSPLGLMLRTAGQWLTHPL
jgi:multidrug resistance efflux pump